MEHQERTAVEQVRDFAERIFRRADGPDEVVPPDHVPNWLDRPARWRLYPDMPRIPLQSPGELHQKYSDSIDAKSPPASQLEQLALVLYLMAGPLKRKMDINWNADPPLIAFGRQEYTRGSASGGGLYPAQLYLVAGEGQAPGAGVYHYSNLEHALVPLRHGDWTGQLASAINGPRYAYYIVVAIDFWMSAFKYHAFGYHVCCEDTGTMLATLHLVCQSAGLAHTSFLAFDDKRTNEVIGANGETESAFAVVGIGPELTAETEPGRPVTAVRQPWQRSRQMKIPAALANVHSLTMAGPVERNALTNAALTLPRSVDSGVPPALDEAIRKTLPSVLMSRKSAWSSMRGATAIHADRLINLLRFVWGHSQSSPQSPREVIPSGMLQIGLRVNDVTGIERGLYRWVPESKGLTRTEGDYLDLWQSTYSMNNYNIDEVACTLFLIGNLPQALELYGPRGYRILNAHVGIAAQLAYVAAAGSQLDCGVVLGVRAQRVKRALRLDADQNVFLAIYLSQAQKRVELFSFNLLPDVPPCQ